MTDIKTNKFGAKVLDKATQSLIHFNSEVEQTEFLIFFILIGNEYISENKEQARKILIDAYEDPTNEFSIKLVEFFKTDKAEQLFDSNFYAQHFSQMAYSRAIDNFITYFKEILAEVVLKTPQILKSKDTERLDFILGHDNFEDLLKAISEKKIEELFYKGIADIEKFFLDRLAINLFKDDETSKTINRLIKQRNLIVHNRGRISKEFANEFKDDNYEVGLYLVFNYEDISYINLFLSNFLVDLDTEISNKFKLDLLSGQ